MFRVCFCGKRLKYRQLKCEKCVRIIKINHDRKWNRIKWLRTYDKKQNSNMIHPIEKTLQFCRENYGPAEYCSSLNLSVIFNFGKTLNGKHN